jgi:hypothetical protein
MSHLSPIIAALIIAASILGAARMLRPEDSVTRIGKECSAYAEWMRSRGLNPFDALEGCHENKLLGIRR